MSGPSVPIPPIEIGSFVAPRADKSEFIGSASGVFFANTVFRSFATLLPASGPGSSEDSNARDPADSPGPAPDSAAHDYVLAENVQEQEAEDAALYAVLHAKFTTSHVDATDTTTRRQQHLPETLSYVITVPGLGVPPTAATARSLLMQYFQKWHPFFPFLHGPTFFSQVNTFYDTGSISSTDQQPKPGLRARMLQAVTFQCIFNIAAGSTSQLEEASRISSTAALTSLLGVVSSGHDLPSLQALLAMEIYLMTRMALRAASTVHGTLTRILYHCGLHRCPFRYTQLPLDVGSIRQRIFWCAYILDRQLSQLLGHPPAIKDSEVDVCIPGMAELHNPVKAREAVPSSPADNDGEEVTAHLPRGHVASQSAVATKEFSGGAARSPADFQGVRNTGIEAESPARHHKSSPKDAGEFVLGYLVTYSRLSGAAFDLFHTSITNRHVTWEQVLELSSKIQSWWNGLPLSLQENVSTSNDSSPQFSSYFITLHQYFVLFINRSPLSLPTHRLEFRSSIQSALSASRAIVQNLRNLQHYPALFAWPTTLSATWMSGLVIAFATLLNLYPFHKAYADLNDTMSILDKMNSDWVSARHCRAAINTLLVRLTARTDAEPTHNTILNTTNDETANPADQYVSVGNKRRRQTRDTERNSANQDMVPSDTGPSVAPSRHPVLEYSGPDFGFDSASATTYQGGWENLLSQNINLDSSGQLFYNAEWDVYMQNFGDRFGL